MPGLRSVYVQALRRAAEILGDKAELRARLRVPMSDLDAWMRGAAPPPTYVFLEVVDLIAAATSPAERSLHIRRSLLEQREPVSVVRRHSMTAASYAAMGVSTWDRHVVLGAALNAALNDTAATRVNVQLACPEGLRIVAQLGFRAPFLEFFATVNHKVAAACGRAFEDAKRVLVPDVLADPIFVGTPAADVMEAAGALAVQSTPLRDPGGGVIGMISTHYEQPHEFSAGELAAIDLIARSTSLWLSGRTF